MTIQEDIELMKGIRNCNYRFSDKEHKAIDASIRSLDAWENCLYQLYKQKSIDEQPRAIGRAIRIVEGYLKGERQ